VLTYRACRAFKGIQMLGLLDQVESESAKVRNFSACRVCKGVETTGLTDRSG
jgi:hypothetical protein